MFLLSITFFYTGKESLYIKRKMIFVCQASADNDKRDELVLSVFSFNVKAAVKKKYLVMIRLQY